MPRCSIGCCASRSRLFPRPSSVFSQAKFGISSVAYHLAGLTQQLPLLAGTLLMPLFVTLQTGKREDRSERFIREVLPSITLLWTIACALLATIGSYVVPLVFGSKFAETARP